MLSRQPRVFLPVMSTSRLAPLLVSGEYSDLTLECQGEVFKVHKAIVCSHSPVIAAAVGGNFQVHKSGSQRPDNMTVPFHAHRHIFLVEQEAKTSVVKVDGFDVATVKRMINFMYGAKEATSSEDAPAPCSDEGTTMTTMMTATPMKSLLAHVRVNAIADYYNIPELGKLATAEMRRLLDTAWSADDFLEAATEALSTTGDRELHRLFADSAASHLQEIVHMDRFAELDVVNDFTMRLLQGCAETFKALNTLQDRQSELEAQIARETSWHERETARTSRTISNMRECVQTLGKTKFCRYKTCEADFTCIIEEEYHPDYQSYTLRCARCSCRHTS